MKKTTICIAIICTAIFSCNSQKNKTADTVEKPKTLVMIDSLEGSGSKQSNNFHLSGGPVALMYSYKSNIGSLGVFSAYVIDKGHDFNKEGGMPDLTVSSPEEKSSTKITRAEGDYYLKVLSAGNYKIYIAEWK